MSGGCRDCRFFDGTSCPKERSQGRDLISPGSRLNCFIDRNAVGDKRCGTCHFFDGLSCPRERQSGRYTISPGNSLSCYASI